MKSSLAFVVLGALLTCGACFAESNKEAREYVADDVPIPAGAIKINVVEEPILKAIAEEQTSVDDVALSQVFQEKLQALPSPSSVQQSPEGVMVEEQALNKPVEELDAEDDVILPQVYQDKLRVPLANFAELKNKAEEYVADDIPIPAGAVKINIVEEPILKTIAKEQSPIDNVALSQVFQEKVQVLPTTLANQQSSEEITVAEHILNKTIEELDAEDDVVLPQVTQDKLRSSKEVTVKDTAMKKVIEELDAEDDVVLSQVYQDKPDLTKNQQFSEEVTVEEPSLELDVELAPVDKEFSEDMRAEKPSVKKSAEETALEDEVDIPQVFEEVRQDIPSSAETVEEPAVKKTTAVNKENDSGPVETVAVKEQRDAPTIADKEHSSNDRTAKESASEDEVDLPQVFEEVLKNQTVEEPAFKIKTEEPAPEDVLALPPVLAMVMQKPSKSVYAYIITQQADKKVNSENMVESEMRLPRQVQHHNNVDEDNDRSTDELVDKHAVRRHQNVRNSNSKKRMNPTNPNNWNAVRCRNVKKGQVMKNGQWVRNEQLMKNGQWANDGQWVRKDQLARRKKTNNQGITHWYNMKNFNVIMRPQNVNKRAKNNRHRINGNNNRIRSQHRRPSKKQRKNKDKKQRGTAIQLKQFSNQSEPRPIIIISEKQRN